VDHFDLSAVPARRRVLETPWSSARHGFPDPVSGCPLGRHTVVALTVTGDRYCKATTKDYRVDSPTARAFLGDYVTLP